MLHASSFGKTFHFNFRARTSRGLMQDKTSWFVVLEETGNPGVSGIGECGPLPGLSADDRPDYAETLAQVIRMINAAGLRPDAPDSLLRLIPPEYPSLLFGFETALLDLRNGGRRVVFDNGFVRGEPIPINGLIWMGDLDFTLEQINKKVAAGFTCIKLKVGGLDFERECDILDYIRKKYFRQDITIRLDANGAFKVDDALYKLDALKKFRIHSIEQPLKPGAPEMEALCRKSPIPVAFDEELIGITGDENKRRMLEKLKPQFIVLKPSLHGGIRGCEAWISIAESMNIGWWITSALESAIGLNAICQFTANYAVTMPQGLGTGAIYEDNFDSPLIVKDGHITYNRDGRWDPLPEAS